MKTLTSAGNATSVLALELLWLEEDTDEILFRTLGGEEFACYDASCAPPPIGKGGSSRGGAVRGKFDVSRGTTSKGVTGSKSHRLEDMDPKGIAQAMEVIQAMPGMGHVKTVEDAVNEVQARLEANVDVALERGYTLDQARSSAHWYEVANDYAGQMADEFGYNYPETGAAVLAALSPSAAWEGNVRNARELMKKVAENKPITDSDIEMAYNRTVSKLESGLTNKKTSAKRKAEIAEELERFKDPSVLKGMKDKSVGKNFLDIDEDLQVSVLNGHIQGNAMKGIALIPSPDGSYKVTDYKSKTTVQSNAIIKKTIAIAKADRDGATPDEMAAIISENVSQQSKVRAFYKNIADPHDRDQAAVTLDTHAWSGAFSPVNATTSKPLFTASKTVGFAKTYPIVREAMERMTGPMSERLGMPDLTPRSIQSITWETTRYLYPTKGKGTILSGLKEGQYYSTPEIDAAYAAGDHKTATHLYTDDMSGPKRTG